MLNKTSNLVLSILTATSLLMPLATNAGSNARSLFGAPADGSVVGQVNVTTPNNAPYRVYGIAYNFGFWNSLTNQCLMSSQPSEPVNFGDGIDFTLATGTLNITESEIQAICKSTPTMQSYCAQITFTPCFQIYVYHGESAGSLSDPQPSTAAPISINAFQQTSKIVSTDPQPPQPFNMVLNLH